MAHDHAHDDDEHDHDHSVALEGTDVDDETLKLLDVANPNLSEILSLTRRLSELTEAEKEDAARLHTSLEEEGPWVPGFHAEGDLCAVCEESVPALFSDRMKDGAEPIPYSAFAADLPVHVACIPKFDEKYPRLAPRVLDQARRKLMRDLDRPTASMAAYFRTDLLRHDGFDLEEWADSVFEANEDEMTRGLQRDVEKCIRWVHHRIHPHHAHDEEHEEATQR